MKLHTVKDSAATETEVTEAKSEAEKVFTVNMETGKILKSQSANNKEACNQNSEEKNNFNNENVNRSSTRILRISKDESGTFGFDITRTKWDPYPWISRVDENSPSEMSGLKVGDCVLKVNGKDVLGLRIMDIAKLVQCKSSHVTLHLWSAGCDAKCDPDTLCDAPMPVTLQRLSIIVQSILSIIECPVCLDTISPPAMQCQNGHLLCVNCRIRADKCPVCRDRYTPKQALIAEQIYAAITNAFNLCRSEDKLRHKLFGTNVKQHPQQQQQTENMSNNMGTISQDDKEIKSSSQRTSNVKCNGVSLPATNKFLTKLLLGKACSMDNLLTATTAKIETPTMTSTASTSTTSTTTPAATTALTSSFCLNSAPLSSVGCLSGSERTLNIMGEAATNSNITSNDRLHQSTTNQLNCTTTTASIVSESNGLHLDGETLLKNTILQENGMSEHISLSIDDLCCTPTSTLELENRQSTDQFCT